MQPVLLLLFEPFSLFFNVSEIFFPILFIGYTFKLGGKSSDVI